MKHERRRNFCLSIVAFALIQACDNEEAAAHFDWQQLPQLPDPVGFAGVYAGVSGGSLIVAGGANFPEGTRPWSGGVQQWSDQVFALEGGSNRWTRVGHLPRDRKSVV